MCGQCRPPRPKRSMNRPGPLTPAAAVWNKNLGKTGQPFAHLNYSARLDLFCRWRKRTDTFRGGVVVIPYFSRELSQLAWLG
jgi:hypothetical protein